MAVYKINNNKSLNKGRRVNESYYDGKVRIRELRSIMSQISDFISMMEDEGVDQIQSDSNTYGLSTPLILTSSGYIDLSNPEKYLGEEEFDDDDDYDESLTESTDLSVTDYKVFSLNMDVAVPGDKSLRDFGVGSTDPRNPLYNALSKALESVGLEMAGDYIDSDGDVTDIYKDNDYEFFN